MPRSAYWSWSDSCRNLGGLLIALLAGMVMMAGASGAEREIAAIEAVLAADIVDTELFSPGFLAAVPVAQLQPAIADVRQQIGPITGVAMIDESRYRVETATHTMLVEIALDGNGQIAGLLFRPATARALDMDTVLGDLQAIAPDVHLLVTRNGEALHAIAPGRPLAVGSAFKLGVLKALSDQIAAGTHGWDDVAVLEDQDKSLPSGTLQTWPTGSPLTLHTLAALMISMSDNTATDLLIRIVGRENVEQVLGITPVLTTRELFTLKAHPELSERYVGGELSARRDILTQIASLPTPPPGQVMTHYDPQMEWTISAERLCTLIESVAEIDVMTINPGVVEKSDWKRVAFKGGSESGVLNMTTALTAADGTRYCVAATWNSPEPIDEKKAFSAYGGLLALLKQG